MRLGKHQAQVGRRGLRVAWRLYHATVESQQWFHMTHALLTVQDVTQSVWVCFILFYIYIFGILYIAVGVKIVF